MTITITIETDSPEQTRAQEVARRFANGTCDGYLLAATPGAVDAWRAMRDAR